MTNMMTDILSRLGDTTKPAAKLKLRTGWIIRYSQDGGYRSSRKLYTHARATELVSRLRARGTDAYASRMAVKLPSGTRLAGES